MIAFQNVRLLTGKGELPDGMLLVRDGKIAAVGRPEEVPLPPGADVVFCSGEYLSPGWIDLQINGGFGYDFTADPESIWAVAERLPQFGVTSFLPTIISTSPDGIRRAMNVMRRGEPAGNRGAQALGLHLEGPFLNPARRGAHSAASLRQPDVELIEDWTPADGVRLVTLAPELPGALDVVQKLVERGVVVGAGHTAATYEEAYAGFDAGITYGTHLFNAQSGLEHRNPGMAAALIECSSCTAGLIADGIHVHPAFIRLAWRQKGPRAITLVTDATAALGMPDGAYLLGELRVEVDDGTVHLAGSETLAGSSLSLDAALRNLVAFTGCGYGEAVLTVSETPASLMNLTGKGTLRVGADADLTLFDAEGQVRMTVIGGRIAYRADL